MKIIAFAGLAQAGKTTAAEAAAAHLFDRGYNPVIEQFAGPLKRAAAMLGFVKGGETDHLYREFCQWAGQRARAENPDWFVHLLSDRLDVIAQEESDRLTISQRDDTQWYETVVLIDDLRFHNERAKVVEYSGTTVFISAMRRLKDMDASWRQHVSETMATLYERGETPDETFDMTVSNNDGSGSGIAPFMDVIASVAYGICTKAREEML